jgi:hypothetical protein
MLLAVSYTPNPYQKDLKHFYPREVLTVADIAAIITKRPWSPAVFRDNKRSNANFLYADYFGLDFDGEMTLQDAEAWLEAQNLRYIIGLTKSHTDGDHCFRVIVPWHERICDGFQYTENIKALAKMLPIDEGSWQCGRFYTPCKQIYKVSTGGLPAVWFTFERPPPRVVLPALAHGKHIPAWARDCLEFGVAPHTRNLTIYKIACDMFRNRFTHEEIIREILNSAIDFKFPDLLTEEELHIVVRSASERWQNYSPKKKVFGYPEKTGQD